MARSAAPHRKLFTLAVLLALAVGADATAQPAIVRLEVRPGPRILHAPGRWQQLSVRAHFRDGSAHDVTRLTVFSSSDEAIATGNAVGLVEFAQPGAVAILCRYLQTMQAVTLTYLEPKAGFVWPNPPAANLVDRHVFAKLKLLSLPPSELCDDATFIRRAYLDLGAILPAPDEVRAFLADPAPDRRARLIDQLLERPEYVDFWSMKWLDVLRATRTNLKEQGVKAYRGWLQEQLRKNTPFDEVARTLLTARGNAFQNGPANFFRAIRTPEELAEATAQLFCGVRLQCARCHNHPFERWTQDDYYGLAAFFAQVGRRRLSLTGNEDIHVNADGTLKHPRTGLVMRPRALGADLPPPATDGDPRQALADWLTGKDNPFFARALVNRVWFHLLGRGIVDPVDDFRDSNPPANEALLDALAQDFVAHGHDVKRLIRTIMNARTYQLSAVGNDLNRGDARYFSHTILKLLTAEQLLDAIAIATGVPEEFADAPKAARATQLVDGELNHPFLKAFGQPSRDLTCECERGDEANIGQALQLLNTGTINARLRAGQPHRPPAATATAGRADRGGIVPRDAVAPATAGGDADHRAPPRRSRRSAPCVGRRAVGAAERERVHFSPLNCVTVPRGTGKMGSRVISPRNRKRHFCQGARHESGSDRPRMSGRVGGCGIRRAAASGDSPGEIRQRRSRAHRRVTKRVLRRVRRREHSRAQTGSNQQANVATELQVLMSDIQALENLLQSLLGIVNGKGQQGQSTQPQGASAQGAAPSHGRNPGRDKARLHRTRASPVRKAVPLAGASATAVSRPAPRFT